MGLNSTQKAHLFGDGPTKKVPSQKINHLFENFVDKILNKF